MEKVMFDRHIEVKGDSDNPVKLPAIETFVPTMSSKVIPLTTGSADGSNFSSG